MQKHLKLRRAEDFARMRREGRAYRHTLLLMSVAPNSLTHNRYGVVTAKRVGKAVQRNRVRRQIREAVRALHPHLRTGYDVVFIAHPPLVGKPFSDILRTLSELLSQASLLEQEP